MMSSSEINQKRFLIPLNEVRIATKFSPENLIGSGGFGKVYRGQLSAFWENRTAAFKVLDPSGSCGVNEFHNELRLISRFNHENIVPFIGYCDEEDEMIIVTECAINGSVEDHLRDPNKRRSITWAQRLKICIGAARGLEYLHSGLGNTYRVIHRDMRSANILLFDNLEVKVCGFVLSIADEQNQPIVNEPVAGTPSYIDPIYSGSGILSTKSDIYSFGMIMFEMLSGMLAYNTMSVGDVRPQKLVNLVRRHYHEGMEILIDPLIRDQVNIHSFHAFKEIAYQCISWNLKDRPTMDDIIKRIGEAMDIQNHGAALAITIQSHRHQSLERFLIPLEEIRIATGNFNPHTEIGQGGFGVVYMGVLQSEPWQNCKVAIKRLGQKGHHGKNEFLAELKLISNFSHENIIPFVGYCDEDSEMIIVCKYASNGSLDRHLDNKDTRHNLTWVQRLKICLGAAKGLNYLHSGLSEDNIVIHRDIKSANILLDENLEARFSDFGLSKQIPRNQQQTPVFTEAAGTTFYMDPIYDESGILQKESDVYSFGVVLFEMLSGRLAHQLGKSGDGNLKPLIYLVRRYNNDGFDRLIDPFIRDQIGNPSFYRFTDIAYKCISYNADERPSMDLVIECLKDAMDLQELERL